MINRDGVEEKASSAITSPFDPQFDRESDGEDELSHYSSCGESEFDRYCSASSAMGTPSFCSSSYLESDFGSLKSFKLGGESANFKNFADNKILPGFSCRASSDKGAQSSSDWKGSGMPDMNERVKGFVMSGLDVLGNSDVDDNWGNEGVDMNIGLRNCEEDTIAPGKPLDVEGVKGFYRGTMEGSDEGEGLEIPGDKDRKLSDEGEVLSSHDHSEGDDSIFGCGGDDSGEIDSYYGKNVLFHVDESGKNEHQLVMNSKVAFGSDDWDDFIQENGGHTVSSVAWNEFQGGTEGGIDSLNLFAADSIKFPLPQADARSTSVACDKIQPACKSADRISSLRTNLVDHEKLAARVPDVKEVFMSRDQVSDMDELTKSHKRNSNCDAFESDMDSSVKKGLANEELKIHLAKSEMKHQYKTTTNGSDVSEDGKVGKTNIDLNPRSKSEFNIRTVKDKDRGFRLFEDENSLATSSFTDMNMSELIEKKSAFSFDKVEGHFEPVKTRDFELKDFYDEIVNDMEDILLDSGDTPVARYTQGSRMYEVHFSQQSRDGGSSASTSGTDYANNWIRQPLRIDNVEVVGARQIEGDVSLSDRLVGVKKYTVYKIRVWGGEECWEVERRYRDFSTLYQRLKKQFSVHGWTLPSPWSHVDRESRKLFGNASPDVVADRSVLIQECLQSVVAPKFTSSSLSALLCFLSQSEAVPDSPANNANIPQTLFPYRVTNMENLTTLGKTISLNVQTRPFKSMKQILDAQHYRCSGCHRNFDDGRTRLQEYFQVVGWGKPRLCEYSGQLFCSSCHNNDTAILPARVLHYWDFTRYPVSQMAKSYLDSIYDQPMLCVSAVNPFLFSKVPALQHVANTRNRIAAMLPYVRCPFRRSIDKGLGSRRYILDSNDFFALRDLIDLSKGIFSALPVMVETVSRKVYEHITEQCLVCYDAGVPCNARHACNNPMSLIFPFQEEEIEKCRACGLVFHKNCFKTIVSCPCGAHFKQKGLKQSAGEGIHVAKSNLKLLGGTTESGNGFISGLFSKLSPKISQNLGKNEPKDADNVILMGSLTNGSL